MKRLAVTVVVAVSLGVLPGCPLRGGGRPAPHPDAKADPIAAAVSKIVRSTAADDDDSLGAAAAALAGLGEAAVPQLAKSLADPDEGIRLVVVQVLGKMRTKEGVDLLLTALNDESWNVRQNAVEALGAMGDRRAVKPVLKQYDKDEDAQVRYECLTSLGRLGDPSAADLLLKETKSEDPYARMWAMDALCQMRDAHAPSLAVTLLKDPNLYVTKQVLQSCREAFNTPEGHQALIDVALFSGDFQASVWARQHLLSYMRGGTAFTKLAEKIRTVGRKALKGNHAVRAALLLGDLADPAATDRLIEALENPNFWIRHQAAYDLGKIGDRRAVPALVKALGDGQALVAATAYNSLQWFAEVGDSHAQEAVKNYTGKKFDQPLPR